jgi:4-amino-4-deoxy-L-arabinose transferase-like glycosyltransferase
MDSEYKPSSAPNPISIRIIQAVISFFSLTFIVAFIVIASARLFYPYELEWIEGVSIDASRWILDGHFLFSQPSLQFIPLIYGPVFFYISAFSMQVFGIGFAAARLVSILSTIGCFALLFLIVSRSSSSKIAGLLAAGAWMDLAKVDSLALFFLLAGFWVNRRFPSRAGMIGTGLLYVLAYYTKQNTVIVILVLILLSLVESRGRTWVLLATVTSLGIAVSLLFNFISQGWYSIYRP